MTVGCARAAVPEKCAHCPRVALGEISACKTGAVELIQPMPIPLTILPTISWGRPKAAACNTAPPIIHTAPSLMLLFLPSLSPSMKAKIAPAKHPISYEATIVDSSPPLGLSNVLFHAGAFVSPPMTPLSYPISMKHRAVRREMTKIKRFPCKESRILGGNPLWSEAAGLR